MEKDVKKRGDIKNVQKEKQKRDEGMIYKYNINKTINIINFKIYIKI